ncbi:MAG: polysaccharide biosynthesis/export family protein [Bacteroidota bacterium]
MTKRNCIGNSYLLVLVALVLFSSCGSRNEQTLFNAATDVNAESIKDVYVVNDQGEADIYYKIKLNDVIAINNLQNKEWGASKAPTTTTNVLSTTGDNITTYRVDIDGTVNLPAIGKVLLAGLTRREATAKLQDLYGSNEHLKDPIIELNVVNLKVTLLGEFNKQGNFLLTKENTSLVEIIGEAGGFTKTADPKTLKIIRGNRSNPEIIYVNLTDIKSLASKKLILQNNDILYLQQTKNAVLADRLQKSNNIIQPLLVVVNLAILIFTLTK